MKTAKQSVELLDWCGDDLSVVNAARVSFAKQSSWSDTDMELPEKDAKLIKYLAKHKHKSPFNHCFMSFRVKAPIFVARQLVKHEYLPWNEVSRRYVTEEPEFYIPEVFRAAADNVKQGSSDKAVPFLTNPVQRASATALMVYDMLLEQGVCPEQARMVLPQNTMTEWIWSGTLFAFAKMIDGEAKTLYPVSWEALMEYGE